MFGEMIQGLFSIFQPDLFFPILLGVAFGQVIGILPGIGGLAALAILLPIVYGMEPLKGLTLLVATHASCNTGGQITAILLNIPGNTANAATMFDGFPMTQQGKAGRALGAGLCAPLFGGILGALVLLALIPVVRPIVLAFGSPETFFLALFAISYVGVLSQGSMIKGLICGGMGIMLALFGFNSITGEARYSFGSVYLLDGVRLVPLVLGLFAIPETADMFTMGDLTAKGVPISMTNMRKDILEGAKDVFRHWWLFLRCSAIGVWVGILPGAGSETAPFLAYAHAKQTSKHPEKFGQGSIEGVIGPGCAINSKEGGDLLPTLAFGIPGSAAMAVLLGGFIVLGLEPGPLFLKQHLGLATSLVSTIVVSNILAVLMLLPLLSRHLVKIAYLPGHILGPMVLAFCLIGAYATDCNMLDVIWMLAFGVLGYVMKEFKYNRPTLVLGFIMGEMMEKSFNISYDAYGLGFVLKPIALTLFILTILGLSWDWIKKLPFLRRDKT